jgi:hypothetical protein
VDVPGGLSPDAGGARHAMIAATLILAGLVLLTWSDDWTTDSRR